MIISSYLTENSIAIKISYSFCHIGTGEIDIWGSKLLVFKAWDYLVSVIAITHEAVVAWRIWTTVSLPHHQLMITASSSPVIKRLCFDCGDIAIEGSTPTMTGFFNLASIVS